MKPLIDYYKNELQVLDQGAQSFGEQNPAIARYLSQQTSDPDVEMVMQGVAYLTALVKRELDMQFPETLQLLSESIAPNITAPLPCATVMQLTAKKSLMLGQQVDAGVCFDSIPVLEDRSGFGHSCRFQSVWSTHVMPFQLSTVEQKWIERLHEHELTRQMQLTLSFSSEQGMLEQEALDSIRFFINQPLLDTAQWYLLWQRHCIAIEFECGGECQSIDLAELTCCGFHEDFAVYKAANSTLLHQVISDYFLFPEKLGFYQLSLKRLENLAGKQFKLHFYFSSPGWAIPELKTEQLCLNAVPAVNQFDTFVDPIPLDLTSPRMKLNARQNQLQGGDSLPIVQIKSIESSLTGRQKNQKYVSLINHVNNEKVNRYAFYRSYSDTDQIIEHWLTVYNEALLGDQQQTPGEEVLRVEVSCCNGALAERINTAEVIKSTFNSPELIEFCNITKPNKYCEATVVSEQAWQAISDQATSLVMIDDADALKSLLMHHIPESLSRDSSQAANIHRINAIESLNVKHSQALIKGVAVRGRLYTVVIRAEHFASEGERYVFACLIEKIFSIKTGLNSFCQICLVDATSGEQDLWPICLANAI